MVQSIQHLGYEFDGMRSTPLTSVDSNFRITVVRLVEAQKVEVRFFQIPQINLKYMPVAQLEEALDLDSS